MRKKEGEFRDCFGGRKGDRREEDFSWVVVEKSQQHNGEKYISKKGETSHS